MSQLTLRIGPVYLEHYLICEVCGLSSTGRQTCRDCGLRACCWDGEGLCSACRLFRWGVRT